MTQVHIRVLVYGQLYYSHGFDDDFCSASVGALLGRKQT